MEVPSSGTHSSPEPTRFLSSSASDSTSDSVGALRAAVACDSVDAAPSSIVTPRCSERLLDVAGMCVRVRTECAEDLDLLGRVLGDRPWPHEADDVVELSLSYSQPSVPNTEPDFAGPYGDHWSAPDRAWFRHHWGLSAAVRADHVHLGGPAKGYRRWVAVRNSMLFVLAHLYMERGRYLVHAAALHHEATPDAGSETFLVVAGSGKGKSTLTYAAPRAGMQVMGDDMVVVTPTGLGITAQGVQRVPTVPIDVMQEAVDPASVLPGEDRRRVEIVGAILHPDPEPTTAVVMCGHDSGSGRLVEATAQDALEQLTAAFVLSALREPMMKWFPIAARLANGPRLALLHASDPAVRVERAAEMLHDAMVRCAAREQR